MPVRRRHIGETPESGPRGPRRRGYVRGLLVVCLLGLVAATLATYRVSLAPPGLHPHETQFAAAKAEALIDTSVSQLGDQRQDPQLGMIAHLAEVNALFLKTDMARRIAADAAGVPGKEIAVSGPFNMLLNQTNHPVKGPVITDPAPVAANYRLVVDFDGWHPLVTLYSQAPTVRAAVAIVQSMRRLMASRIAEQERSFALAPTFAAVVRPLGPPTAGVVDPGAQLQLFVLVFGLVAFFGGSLVLAAAKRRERRASGEADVDLGRLEAPASGLDEWPHTRRLLPWSLAAFLFMVFLVPIDSISLPIHLPLDSKPDRVVLVAITLLWVSSLAVLSGAARPRLTFSRTHLAIFAFAIICFLSVVLNGHDLALNQSVTPVLKKLVLLMSFVIFFVIAASVLRPREVPKFIKLMLGLTVVVALAAIVERTMKYNVFYSLWGKVLPVTPPVALDKVDGIGRLAIDGPTAQPLELAALLAIMLPFAIMEVTRAAGRRQRIMYLLVVAILLGGALVTGRKSGVVAPVFGLLVLIAYRPRQMLRGILVSALPLFVVVHIMAPGQIGSTLVQLLPGRADAALTTKDRVVRYDAVRPDIMSHLLIGSGFQSYDPVKNRILDNQLLGLMIEVGGIGLAAYLTIFFILLGTGHSMIRGPDPARAAAALAAQAAIITTCVANTLFDELSFTHVSYLFFFIAAMVVALRVPTPETAAVPVRRTPHLPPAGRWVAPPDPVPAS